MQYWWSCDAWQNSRTCGRVRAATSPLSGEHVCVFVARRVACSLIASHAHALMFWFCHCFLNHWAFETGRYSKTLRPDGRLNCMESRNPQMCENTKTWLHRLRAIVSRSNSLNRSCCLMCCGVCASGSCTLMMVACGVWSQSRTPFFASLAWLVCCLFGIIPETLFVCVCQLFLCHDTFFLCLTFAAACSPVIHWFCVSVH